MNKRYSFLLLTLLCAAMAVIFFYGSIGGVKRGAHDYQVFYEAGKHIIQSEPLKIYQESSDRFLYAPGFAWVFSLTNLIEKNQGFWIWSLGKLLLIFLFIYFFSRFYSSQYPTQLNSSLPLIIPLLAFAMISRGLLMDYQYGQVNLYMLLLSCLSLLVHTSLYSVKPITQNKFTIASLWFLLAVFSFSKLFILPLLIIPFLGLIKKNKPRGLNFEIAGLILGSLFILLLPLISTSSSQFIDLYQQWYQSIMSKGLPLDGHNQSFYAFLNRILGEEITFVLFDLEYHFFCFYLLSKSTIEKLALSWSALTLVSIFFMLYKTTQAPTLKNSFILISLLILPSHIIWKHYYIFYFPLFILALSNIFNLRNKKLNIAALMTVTIVYNFSTFGFIGTNLAARLEAYSVLLWVFIFLFTVVTLTNTTSMKTHQTKLS